ncbi:uncharacterized protein LOC131168726 isoform X2 [Hevea brasiliensis]|uniref:uncharacterized protein LOC131168726 isoform X2 n=1 Tax=Hevea brasiliensis TaxID=3981 RepID=UPI0025E3C930|nr:uncharacterized protein LOC131168726 isoform X2 [Hevea brasiliensis]
MSTTIYMLLRHRCGEMVLSMFEIKIPKDETAEPHHLSAILEFPEREYPRGMCSVQLGSEFYFLGGERDLEDPRAPFDQWFPKDVYIFDPIDGKGSMKRGVSMNTGKSNPCAVVADGHFRVLSVFNLDTLEWTSSTKLEKEKITADDFLTFTAVGEDSSDKYLYGLHGLLHNRILRSGPLSNIDQNPRMFSSLPIKTISMRGEVDSFYDLDCSSFILHLGNQRFCYLHTGTPHPFGYHVTIEDDYPRTLKLFVFEETNCSASEFNPKIVYSASFDIKTSFINKGGIMNCHILSPGEKHESMKRKQEDSWKHENMKRNKKITGSMRA